MKGERAPAARSAPRWEHFAHDADIGIHGMGSTPAQAFEQAALALTAIVTDPAGVAQEQTIELECESPDPEVMLVDWLNALIYEAATRRMVFGRYQVEIAGGRLRGRAWGEPVEVARHQPAVELKGATYTGLRVHRDSDGVWHAQCVVDV